MVSTKVPGLGFVHLPSGLESFLSTYSFTISYGRFPRFKQVLILFSSTRLMAVLSIVLAGAIIVGSYSPFTRGMISGIAPLILVPLMNIRNRETLNEIACIGDNSVYQTA